MIPTSPNATYDHMFRWFVWSWWWTVRRHVILLIGKNQFNTGFNTCINSATITDWKKSIQHLHQLGDKAAWSVNVKTHSSSSIMYLHDIDYLFCYDASYKAYPHIGRIRILCRITPTDVVCLVLSALKHNIGQMKCNGVAAAILVYETLLKGK